MPLIYTDSKVFTFLLPNSPHTVTLLGIEFATLQHAFQFAKCTDSEYRDMILECPTASDAYLLGRKCERREEWQEIKVEQLKFLTRLKFAQNPDILASLLKIEDNIIHWEQNETFWSNWNYGLNVYGKILTYVRDYYKNM